MWPPGGPVISIVDFKSGQKAIRFGLKDYARIPTEGRTVGSAAVRITIFNDKSEQVFADGKTLELVKDETKISLELPPAPVGLLFHHHRRPRPDDRRQGRLFGGDPAVRGAGRQGGFDGADVGAYFQTSPYLLTSGSPSASSRTSV